MASQKDPSLNEFLDLRPAVLLLPIGLGGQARVINQSQYDPDNVASGSKAQMKPNVVVGLFGDVVDTPRLTGTRRYLFADPSIAPVLEVAFLDGQQNARARDEGRLGRRRRRDQGAPGLRRRRGRLPRRHHQRGRVSA
jgi:hypothetical protein